VLNSVNQLIFVMVKCGVLFEVRTEFLNIIQTSFGFKELNSVNQLISVMVKCGVLFEVRTEFLNIIQTSLVFKVLELCYRWTQVLPYICAITDGLHPVVTTPQGLSAGLWGEILSNFQASVDYCFQTVLQRYFLLSMPSRHTALVR
jgi:hypothetical protein